MVWHFIPWTLQYLGATVVLFLVAIYVLKNNPDSKVNQSFFFFGITISIGEIFVFLHRNSPNSEISSLFIEMMVLFYVLGSTFLSITVLNILKESKKHLILIIIFLPLAFSAFLFKNYTPIWTYYGWSYSIPSNYAIFYIILLAINPVIISIIGMCIYLKEPEIKYKISLIVYGWVGVNFIGMIFSNYWISQYPSTPPIGGILHTMAIIIVGYGISLPTQIHLPYSKIKGKYADLSRYYLEFITNFRDSIPGDEFGDKIFRFKEYMREIGLQNIVNIKEGRLTFVEENFMYKDLTVIPNSVLNIVKDVKWTNNTLYDIRNIIVETYDLIIKNSYSEAERWLKNLIIEHGLYLSKKGVLDNFPDYMNVPIFFKKYPPGIYFISEKKSKVVLEKIDKYGYEVIMIDDIEKKNNINKYDDLETHLEENCCKILWVDNLNGLKKSIGVNKTMKFIELINSIIRKYNSLCFIIVSEIDMKDQFINDIRSNI